MRSHEHPAGLIRRVFAACAGLLLAVQVAIGFFPVELPPEDGTIRVVICGGGGMQTVTISLIDGSVQTSSAAGESKCPLCVVGAVDLAEPFTPPTWSSAFQSLPRDCAAPAPIMARLHDPAQPIRAPPVVL